MRKGFAQFVDTAKGLQTRKVRAEKMAETVMLAMEGEQEPPPILRAAFQRQPLARSGLERDDADTKAESSARHILPAGRSRRKQGGRQRRWKRCLRVARSKRRMHV